MLDHLFGAVNKKATRIRAGAQIMANEIVNGIETTRCSNCECPLAEDWPQAECVLRGVGHTGGVVDLESRKSGDHCGVANLRSERGKKKQKGQKRFRDWNLKVDCPGPLLS